MRIDDLMAQVTEDDGLSADFLAGVRTAYDEDWAENLGALTESHDSAVAEIQTAHAAEIEALKADFFDKIMSGQGNGSSAADDDEIIDDDSDESPLYQEA